MKNLRSKKNVNFRLSATKSGNYCQNISNKLAFAQLFANNRCRQSQIKTFSVVFFIFFSYHTVQLSTTHIFMYSQIHFLYQIICIFGTHFIPLFALMRTMVRLADVENIAYGYNVRGEKPRKRRMKKKLRAKLNSIPKKNLISINK